MVGVKDIMTREIFAVHPDTPLAEAAEVLARHNFDGVPVTDGEQNLVGILTEYDLVSKETSMHLPTFQMIIQQVPLAGSEGGLPEEVRDLMRLKVADVMNRDPLTLSESATYEETVAAFRDHHRVNPIPVINDQRKVIGVVSRFDVLKPLRDISSLK